MTTIRLWFTKTGEASYISLLDLQRVMQRAFKRSGLPAWYTMGFNPHIYMTFTAPLPLGQESVCESLDFKSEADGFDWRAHEADLAACLPKGIEVVKLEPAGMNPGSIAFAHYEWQVPPLHAQAAREGACAYNDAPAVLVEKKSKHKGTRQIDLKQYLPRLEGEETPDGGVCFALDLPAGSTLTVNPALMLGWICEHSALEPHQVRILRTKLLTAEKKEFC